MSEERFVDCPIAVNEKDYDRHRPNSYYDFYLKALNCDFKNDVQTPSGVSAEYGTYKETKKAQNKGV